MTNTTNMDAAKIAKRLTWEMQALKQIEADVTISYSTWRNLMAKGLVKNTCSNTPDGVYTELTDLGKAVLEASAAASGERPLVITAATFVRENYKAKIDAGECVVKSPLYPKEAVVSIVFIQPNSAGWDIAVTDSRSTYRTYSDSTFEIEWLTPAQPVTAQPEAGDATYTVDAREFDEMRGVLSQISEVFGEYHKTSAEILSCVEDSARDNIRLRRELTNVEKERDIRGTFLDKVVAIRTKYVNDNGNGWLDSIDAIEAALAAARAENAKLAEALSEIQDVARDGQGEWAGVDPVYQPLSVHPFSDIEDIAAKALAKNSPDAS